MGILYAKIAGSWTPIQYGTAYANDAETAAGTLTDKAVTPAGLANVLTNYPQDNVWVGPEAPTDPLVEMWWDTDAESAYLPSVVNYATDAETIAGTVSDKAVTPAGRAAASMAIDPRKYGLATTATGAVNAAALQAAINEACGTSDPVTTTRVASRRVEIPAGTYEIGAPINIRSVIGLDLHGVGFVELRAAVNMTSVFDINGAAYSTFENFTITGAAGVQVDNAFYTYWDAAGSQRTNTLNVYRGIKVRNLDFVCGIRVGKLSSGGQVDNDAWYDIHVTGAWVTGSAEATRYQYGIHFGDTVGANNLNHKAFDLSINHCRYAIRVATTQVMVNGCGIDGAENAIWCSSSGFAGFRNFDLEEVERVLVVPPSAANLNLVLENVYYRAGNLATNGRWCDFSSAGTCHLRAISIVQAAVTPQISGGTNHTRFSVEGLSVRATGNPNVQTWFNMGVNGTIDARGLTSVDSAAGTVLYTTNYYGLPATSTGTTYTFVITDAWRPLNIFNNAAATTVTVPPESSVPWPYGATIEVMQLGAGQVTIAPGAGVVINKSAATAKLRAQYSRARLVKYGTNTWVLEGDLAAS